MQASSHNGNLQAYLWHIFGQLRRTKDRKSAEQLINTLVFTRLLLHHITEHYAPEFWQSLQESAAAPPGGRPQGIRRLLTAQAYINQLCSPCPDVQVRAH